MGRIHIPIPIYKVLPYPVILVLYKTYCKLAANKSDLGIAGFGISVTTMEEVFLKVKEESDESIESR